jgi:hypothetical protein
MALAIRSGTLIAHAVTRRLTTWYLIVLSRRFCLMTAQQ